MAEIKSEKVKSFVSTIIAIAFILFIYGTYKAIQIVNETQIGTKEGTYTSYVSSSENIQDKAHSLTQKCTDNFCKVQQLLDFATNIPYQTHAFQQNSPQKTIQENYGDCDDKSNLLISMLHAIGIEAYFVLVPKHIFVIVPLEDRRLKGVKGIWVNGKKYYILESTAKDSQVGFLLYYKLDEIDAIIDPFLNKKIEVKYLRYN